MDMDLDKKLNRESAFRYPTIDAKGQVRLLRLRLPRDEAREHGELSYDLETVPLEDLPGTHYKALSYIWGHAQGTRDIRAIHLDGQPFWIRANLFDFLTTAAVRGECGLFFIDAVCINQLHHGERQAQVQEMARVYRNADEVVAWLGVPDGSQLGNVRALSQTRSSSRRDCASWSISQWAGFRYLTYHRFWSRIWIVQEVLLASSMVIWCGSFTFPPTLFGGGISGITSDTDIKYAADGRPSTVVSASLRLRSPAAKIITHRLRHVPRPLTDPMAQGTRIGTLEEMKGDLRRPFEVMETYQSKIPDLLYQAMRKFGGLECSDPRDRLYGLMGILKESSRARVQADYTRDVNYAYYQALKIGYGELSTQRGFASLHGRDMDDSYVMYYCDVRDAFGIEDGHSLSILKRVLGELDFKSRLQDAVSEAQWSQQFEWGDGEVKLHPDFELLRLHAEQEDLEAEAFLFKFHARQRHWVQNLLGWRHRSRLQRHKRYRRIEEAGDRGLDEKKLLFEEERYK